jgi:hypothetical protein
VEIGGRGAGSGLEVWLWDMYGRWDTIMEEGKSGRVEEWKSVDVWIEYGDED